MNWIDRLLRRRRLYADLDAEILGHLEQRIEELIARGMLPAEARAAARRAFGNITSITEQGREAWQLPAVDSFVLDIRYALRQMRRTPALSAIIVLTLAIGIAATATVFSWTRSVLLDPLPGAADPGRVLALESTNASGNWTGTSWLDYRDFRKYLRSFDGLAAAYPTTLAVGDEDHAERRSGELVSANFFGVLRVRPELGRFFPPTMDESEGAQPTIVVSHDLWQRRWHGDSAVIGSVVRVNRFPFTVIGVAPPAFHGSMPGERFDIWVPAVMLGQIVPTGGWWLRDRATRTFRVLARLAPEVSAGAAAAEVKSFAALMARANADVSKGMGAQLLPLWRSHWGLQDPLRAPLLVLLAACGLVLVIVCANAAGMLLARATARHKELELRVALGAPRRRLVRQLLTEAFVLATTGSALGLLGALWLARTLRWLVPSFAAPSLLEPHVDGVVLAFVAVLAGAVALLAGVAPALHGSRAAFGEWLGAGARGAVGGVHATRTRSALVTAEMALAVVALVGAGLFYESARHTRAVAPGFDPSHVAMASVSITLAGYDSAHGEALLDEVAQRVREAPGVSAVSYADYVPLSVGQGSWEELRVEGYAAQPAENMKLYRSAIGPHYFQALGIPLVEGRDFTPGDDSAHAAVMIVNQAFVRRFLPRRSALGVRVHGWGRWFTIVGVAKDVKNYRLTEAPTPYFYVPIRQVYRPEYGYTFVARTAAPVDETVRAIVDAVHASDPSVPVFNAMALATYVEGPLQGELAATRLLGLLGAIAALLAALGVYGVVAYAVAQRTKEIGVRVALGAQRSHVIAMVASQARGPMTVGLIAGLAIALALVRIIGSMLYGIEAGGVGVFAGAALMMLALTVVATFVPARRAVHVDPCEALRAE